MSTTKIFERDIKATPPVVTGMEQELIGKLMKLTTAEYVPTRAAYMQIVDLCNNFVELDQWSSQDLKKLKDGMGLALTADRINRNLDTIEGIRFQTGNRKKIMKRELGDERVANLLDAVYDHCADVGNFDDVRDTAFTKMLICGMGVRKVGVDTTGEYPKIWVQEIPVESMGYSRNYNKELQDCTWVWDKRIMDWESAMALNPAKAGELKGLKANLQEEWEKTSNHGSVTVGNEDYNKNSVTMTAPTTRRPDQVEVIDFWLQHSIPVKIVRNLQSVVGMNGQLMQQHNFRTIPMEEEPKDGEQYLGTKLLTKWEQIVVACGSSTYTGIILTIGEDVEHPYVGMCAKLKRDGTPSGFVIEAIPGQERINIALNQKIFANNKSIKSPIIAEEDAIDFENAEQQSSFGGVLVYRKGAKEPRINQVPQLNLQSIEEINAAKGDMDFSASAGSAPMVGMSSPGDSAIKLAKQQDAAMTPLNKWVKADAKSEKILAKKVLRHIIKYYDPDMMMRIVGQQKFIEILIGKRDPITGMPLEPPIQFPLQPDIIEYDVVIEDMAISDFQKQQQFNSVIAAKSMGIPFDDEYIIKCMPIKDVDSALQSNLKARTDIMMQLMQENQVLKDALGVKQKQESGKGTQARNAVIGRMQPQNGVNSMAGGALGVPN